MNELGNNNEINNNKTENVVPTFKEPNDKPWKEGGGEWIERREPHEGGGPLRGPIIMHFDSRIPRSGGEWRPPETPGDGTWVPDNKDTPTNPKTNPEGKTWGDIKSDYDIDGIPFKEGEPDFSEVSKGDVEIDDFSDDRSSNFDQADEKLAEQKGCTPEEVAAWRKENKYTWHEKKDCKTMQKVPTEVHGNVPHSGGVAEYKSKN